MVAFNRAQVRLDGFSERPCQGGFLHEYRHGHRPLVFRTVPTMEPNAAAIREPCIDFRNPQMRVTIIQCSIATVMSAKNLYEFPRADHTHPTLGCLDLDEDCADVRDRADTSPHSYLLAARMPRQLAFSVAPVDFVPNRVHVDDCADTPPVVGP